MKTIDLAKNKERFENIARTFIKRDGIEKLLEWLDKKSDFYTAPASTKYHLCCEGGLCQHSLDVFEAMVKLSALHFDIDNIGDKKPEEVSAIVFNGTTLDDAGSFSMENLALVSLFHDICKCNCYVKDFKNVKNKETGKWESVEYWKWDEQFVYGHGSKSVYILQQYMKLYVDEAQAIRFHMGGREDALSEMYERQYALVFDKSKFCSLLHLADAYSTWLDEFGTSEEN